MTQEEINDLMWKSLPQWKRDQLIAEREEYAAELNKKALEEIK